MYRNEMFRAATLVVVTLASAPALAAATDWQELAPGARVRLISADTLTNGTALAGIELQLPPSANTYWRIPGESGIPTNVDLSASAGVSATDLVWPYPSVEESGGYRDFVYRGDLVLPIRLKAGQGAVLDASLTLGVCSDICVPAKAHLSLALDFAKPDTAQSIRLDQALADAPAAWDQSGAPFGDVSVAWDDQGLELVAPDPSIDPQSLIADIGDPAVVFAAPKKSPDGAIWTLPLLGGEDAASLAGRSVRLTFMTPRGAFFADRTVGPAHH
jgi:DsbC/DsbD-like thiol-disulfide interchange protein